MTKPLLATKLFAPSLSPHSVARLRLTQRLDAGLQGKLSLVCAPAGFGKSTLLSAWLQACEHPSAWLSLDESDRDANQFVAYVTASLRSVSDELGEGALALGQARPRPTPEAVLIHLINRLSQRRGKLVLVLDDYHLASSPGVDAAMTFLLDNMPARLHVVIASCEVPNMALARWRAQGQLLEIGQDELRFDLEETSTFLNRSMALGLSEPQIQALELRTEAWPAGLQMAAVSLAGRSDADAFIEQFSGSHRAVQDYLLEEVLRRQPAEVQAFLLHTSILERMCPALCDAVTQGKTGQQWLRYLAQHHLFVVPLDEERCWYRYHHLFGSMLQQRLRESEVLAPLHLRACDWYETQGMVGPALHHAVAAGDTQRAMQVVEGRGLPLYFLEDAEPVLLWLQDRPPAYLNAHPMLWLMLAWSYLATSQHSQMQAPIVGAEAAIELAAQHADYRHWRGELHAVSAWEAVARMDAAAIFQQANLALTWLPEDQLALRTAAHCALGVAHQFSGNSLAAQQVYGEVLTMAQACGNRMFAIVASIALGHLQHNDNHLHLASRTFTRALQMLGNQPHAVACEVHLGLARIRYQWNELHAAASHAQKSSQLAGALECDSALGADALLAQILLSRAENDAALALLTQASTAAQTRNQQGGRQVIAQVQVQALLQTGEVIAAAQVAQDHALALGQASRATVATSEVLRALLLQALALDAFDPSDAAITLLEEAMALAEPQGCVRMFVDLGGPMQRLLDKATQGTRPRYVALLQDAMRTHLAAVAPAAQNTETVTAQPDTQHALADPLSQRELQILALICKGLSNQEIGAQLFVSLSTVKWHNQNIFDKLNVQRRTEAVARARALDLF
jgi:LuxR family transcriptional regulator, maltose regulon positive regulatory protein